MSEEKRGPGRPAKEKEAKIKQVYLHQALHWTGYPAERTIGEINGRFQGIKMSLGEYGVYLQCKDDVCMVPYANVANVTFEKGEGL